MTVPSNSYISEKEHILCGFKAMIQKYFTQIYHYEYKYKRKYMH